MSTTEFTSRTLVRDDVAADTESAPPPRTRRGRGRLWALTGPLAAVAASAGSIVADLGNPVYDPQTSGDAGRILATLAQHGGALTVFHVVTSAAALLLVVYGVGVARRLRSGLPTDSMVPGLAVAGTTITAAVLLLGTGLDTEVIEGVTRPETFVEETAALYGHWIGTIPYLWTAVGLTGLAIGWAAWRYRTVPRWIGLVALVLGGLTAVAGVSPLEYVASLPGQLLVLVTGLGFALGDRAHRRQADCANGSDEA
ncbi:hypothetical protein GCM10027517_26620 [Phycicoccus ginsengisoli]